MVKLGSTAVGALTPMLVAVIAAKLAAAIEASNQSATNGGSNPYLYNAKSNGAGRDLQSSVIAGYPNDIRTSVSDIPTITFVIDAAGTSTTASLDASATSNSAS